MLPRQAKKNEKTNDSLIGGSALQITVHWGGEKDKYAFLTHSSLHLARAHQETHVKLSLCGMNEDGGRGV